MWWEFEKLPINKILCVHEIVVAFLFFISAENLGQTDMKTEDNEKE